MQQLQSEDMISTIIRMAWADDVSFEKIKKEQGMSETEVIQLMRTHLKAASFRCWRKRVSGRSSKHAKRAAMRREEAY